MQQLYVQIWISVYLLVLGITIALCRICEHIKRKSVAQKLKCSYRRCIPKRCVTNKISRVGPASSCETCQ